MLTSHNGEKIDKIHIEENGQIMISHDISEEVERLLVAHFPRDFWVKALDEMPAAYGSAYTCLLYTSDAADE